MPQLPDCGIRVWAGAVIFKVQGSSEITLKILQTKAKSGNEEALTESFKLNYKISRKGEEYSVGYWEIILHGSLMFLLLSQTEALTIFISDCPFFVVWQRAFGNKGSVSQQPVVGSLTIQHNEGNAFLHYHG